MGSEYLLKIFKSGNSVALRLPKAFGFQPGASVKLREQNGCYVLDMTVQPGKISGEGWIGMVPGLEPSTPEQRTCERSSRPWDEPGWQGWHADS